MDELEALARAATPGPWRWWLGGSHSDTGVRGREPELVPLSTAVVASADGWEVASCQTAGVPRSADAAYIAACSPDVILGLLARLDTAEAAARALTDLAAEVAGLPKLRLTGEQVAEIEGSDGFSMDWDEYDDFVPWTTLEALLAARTPPRLVAAIEAD